MAIRKSRKVVTADKLYVKPPPPPLPPPKFGAYNKFIRYHGMISPGTVGARYELAADEDMDFFVKGKNGVPAFLRDMTENVSLLFDDKPTFLTDPRVPFPDVLTYDQYAREWQDKAEIWRASVQDSPMPIDQHYAMGSSDKGCVYIGRIAVFEGVLGLAIARAPLARRFVANPHSLIAAKQPGPSGGTRVLGISPVLRRIYNRTELYLSNNDFQTRPDNETLLPDPSDDKDYTLDDTFG